MKTKVRLIQSMLADKRIHKLSVYDRAIANYLNIEPTTRTYVYINRDGQFASCEKPSTDTSPWDESVVIGYLTPGTFIADLSERPRRADQSLDGTLASLPPIHPQKHAEIQAAGLSLPLPRNTYLYINKQQCFASTTRQPDDDMPDDLLLPLGFVVDMF